MRRISHARLVSLYLLFLALLARPIGAGRKPLPDVVVHAHTVFVENETGFSELQYALVLELTKWGRFEITDAREKGDLIIRLDHGNHLRTVPDGQLPNGPMNAFSESTELPEGRTRIALIDPKTDSLLWSDTHKTDGGKVKSGHLLDGLRDAFASYEKSRH